MFSYSLGYDLLNNHKADQLITLVGLQLDVSDFHIKFKGWRARGALNLYQSHYIYQKLGGREREIFKKNSEFKSLIPSEGNLFSFPFPEARGFGATMLGGMRTRR